MRSFYTGMDASTVPLDDNRWRSTIHLLPMEGNVRVPGDEAVTHLFHQSPCSFLQRFDFIKCSLFRM